MNGTELITELLGNLSNAFSKVDVITGALVSAIFLRKNTRTEEFEKIKAKNAIKKEPISLDALVTDESLYSCGWLLDISRCLYTLKYICPGEIRVNPMKAILRYMKHLFLLTKYRYFM